MDKPLLEKLKAAFAIEAQEHVHSLRQSLDAIPSISESQLSEWLESAYRSMHSLKGASQAVDNLRISTICMEAESAFAVMKEKKCLPQDESIQLWHKVVDEIEASLTNNGDGDGDSLNDLLLEIREARIRIEKSAEAKPSTGSVQKAKSTLKRESQSNPQASTKPIPLTNSETAALPAADETSVSAEPSIQKSHLRIDYDRMNELMQGVEELVQIRNGNEHQSGLTHRASDNLCHARRQWIKISGLIRQLQLHAAKDDVSQATHNALNQIESAFEETRKGYELLEEDVDFLKNQSLSLSNNSTRIIDRLQLRTRELMLVSINDSFGILHRAVRELADDRGKNVQLLVHGGDTEIDRRIIDSMRDPLLHIVRNAVDHGIETPTDRKAAGKPEKATISIRVDQMQSGRFRINITDDGGGINKKRLKEKALNNHIASAEEISQWEDPTILDTVFLSGISTAKEVSDISGRGLGMSIVREKAESIGGRALVQSSDHTGTTILIDLPMTQAAFSGVCVNAGSSDYILPTSCVAHLMRLDKARIKNLKNQPAISYQGATIPVCDLHQLLTGVSAKAAETSSHVMVAVIQSSSRQIGLRVDHVLGEEEVLVKGLGSQLKHVRHISGVGILSTGKILPILQPAELVESAHRGGAHPEFVPEKDWDVSNRVSKVLVVDDSFTSRMLLSNVLQAADYHVETAVDGSAAFNKLRNGSFDIVVSDVDMPRMNGFVLTKCIRDDQKLANMPVILITSLDKEEDRTRGLDAGASAYLVKSNFDQRELLKVMQRLHTP